MPAVRTQHLANLLEDRRCGGMNDDQRMPTFSLTPVCLHVARIIRGQRAQTGRQPTEPSAATFDIAPGRQDPRRLEDIAVVLGDASRVKRSLGAVRLLRVVDDRHDVVARIQHAEGEWRSGTQRIAVHGWPMCRVWTDPLSCPPSQRFGGEPTLRGLVQRTDNGQRDGQMYQHKRGPVGSAHVPPGERPKDQ